MRHIVSFTRSPLGYIANFVATVISYVEMRVMLPDALVAWSCRACEFYCINDGIQDDPLF